MIRLRDYWMYYLLSLLFLGLLPLLAFVFNEGSMDFDAAAEAAIVAHGITNDAVGISGNATITEALTPLHQFTKNLPFAVIALVLVAATRGNLGLNVRVTAP